MRIVLAFIAATIGILGGTAQAKQCDVVLAKKAWAKCSACHANKPGAAQTLGPNLHKVIGRVAGTVPGYRYSPAMAKSGLKWTPENFDAFTAAPRKAVPGTRMPFSGLKDAAQRAALSCWLSK